MVLRGVIRSISAVSLAVGVLVFLGVSEEKGEVGIDWGGDNVFVVRGELVLEDDDGRVIGKLGDGKKFKVEMGYRGRFYVVSEDNRRGWI
ncbi:MAG: hypothetical protein ABDH28_04695, partial [Brevinematia bacterium]